MIELDEVGYHARERWEQMFGDNYQERLAKPEYNTIEKRLLQDVNHFIKRDLKQSGHSPKEIWTAMRNQMQGAYDESFGNFHRKKKSKGLLTTVNAIRRGYADELTTLKSSVLLGVLMQNPWWKHYSSTDWQCIMYALGHNISRPTINRIKNKSND